MAIFDSLDLMLLLFSTSVTPCQGKYSGKADSRVVAIAVVMEVFNSRDSGGHDHNPDNQDNDMAKIEIVEAPQRHPPFKIEAVILEEDTGLVLTADQEITVIDDHPIRVMTSLIEFELKKVGTVLVSGKDPYRILAIVHDFDFTPSVQATWVERALVASFDECERLDLNNVGLQMLGAHSGSRDRHWFISILERIIRLNPPSTLARIWLMLPESKQT